MRATSKPLVPFHLLIPCLLALAACGPTLDGTEDDVACAGVRCTAGECYSNAGQPMCRCGPWEVAAGLRCAVGDFDEPDDHGGSPGDATVLTTPMAMRTGHIGESDREDMVDRDLFAFTAPGRRVYGFQCAGGTQVDCKPRLLAASGQEVRALVQQQLESRWLFATVEAGTWYVEVSSTGGVGRYSYQLLDLGQDEHADTAERATVLQPSRPHQLRQPFTVPHAAPHDVDMFTFRALKDHGYRFGCEVSRESRFARLSLNAASGEPLGYASADKEPSVSVGLLARIEHDLVVGVSPIEGSPLEVESSCWLEDLGPDDHADVPTGATPVTPGVPIPVALHSGEDRDVLSFTGRAGHNYALSNEQRAVLKLRVTDEFGFEVKSLATSELEFEIPRDGTYFIHVREGTPTLYAFLLLLEDTGIDVHGDTSATATPLAVDTEVNARFESDRDVDAFTFRSVVDGIYLVTCEPACMLTLQHSGGVELPLNLDARRRLLGTSGASAVTLLLQHQREVTTNDYTLRVTQLAVDDYADLSLGAESLTLPASVSGMVQSQVDVDTFNVWLVAGRRYRLTASLGPLGLTLNGPNGRVTLPLDGVFPVVTTGRYVLQLQGALDVELLPWSFTLREE